MVGYVALFAVTERHFTAAHLSFSAPLPAPLQRVALGFLQHIGAEILYVKAAVFLGAPALLPEESAYAENLTQNFEVLTDLYPEFKDAYYLAQSSLPHISPEYAGRTIGILDKGIKVYPDDLILSFFKAFNHQFYRDEAVHAAEIYAEISQWPGAPTWLGHLAAVLSARGGDLYAGLLSLQVMHSAEEDEYIKARYATDIVIFQKAIKVLEATQAYEQKYHQFPQSLYLLVPEFIIEIPDTGDEFELLWLPPRLRLVRPVDK